jgi:hypothetical protein
LRSSISVANDESTVCSLDAQVAPKFGRQVDVDAGELLRARVRKVMP